MKVKALCAVLVPVVVVSGYCLWPRPVSLDLPEPASATTPPVSEPALTAAEGSAAQSPSGEAEAPATALEPAVPAVPVEMAAAMEQKSIVADMLGNAPPAIVNFATALRGRLSASARMAVWIAAGDSSVWL